MPRRIRNSTKVPILSVLLAICGSSRQATVPEVEGRLRSAGHELSHAAVSMALMRYAKHGLISRTREGRWFQYRPNRRTRPGLQFLERSTAVHSRIDGMIDYLDLGILSDNIPANLGGFWEFKLKSDPDMSTVPQHTRKPLYSIGRLLQRLASSKKENEALRGDSDTLEDLLILGEYYKPKDPVHTGVQELEQGLRKRIGELEADLRDARFLSLFFLMRAQYAQGVPYTPQQQTQTLPTHDSEGKPLPSYALITRPLIVNGKVPFNELGWPYIECVAVVTSESQADLDRVSRALKRGSIECEVLTDKAYREYGGELRKALGRKENKENRTDESGSAKKGPIKVRVVRSECLDAGRRVLDVEGAPVLVKFILVQSYDIGDLEAVAKHGDDEPGDRGIELLEEDEGVIPLLTHGPFAGVLKELIRSGFAIERLDDEARSRLDTVLRERGPEISKMRDSIMVIVKSEAFAPRLAKFFSDIDSNRHPKSPHEEKAAPSGSGRGILVPLGNNIERRRSRRKLGGKEPDVGP